MSAWVDFQGIRWIHGFLLAHLPDFDPNMEQSSRQAIECSQEIRVDEMKITVCGWSGATGSEVASQLAARGHRVTGLLRPGSSVPVADAARRPAGRPAEGPAVGLDEASVRHPIQTRVVDYDDEGSIVDAFQGSDAAYLMVPAFEGMVELGLRLHRAAERADLGQVVRLSILTGLVERGQGLGSAHGRLDDDLGHRSLLGTVLRPNGFMQNYLGLADTIGQGSVYTANGEGRAAIVDVQDVAACVVAAFEQRAAGVFDLTGPESLTNDQVAATLSAELGWPIESVTVPPQTMVSAMLAAGLPSWLVDRLMEIQRSTAKGVGAETGDGVQRLTGGRPRSFGEFVRRYRVRFLEARKGRS